MLNGDDRDRTANLLVANKALYAIVTSLVPTWAKQKAELVEAIEQFAKELTDTNDKLKTTLLAYSPLWLSAENHTNPTRQRGECQMPQGLAAALAHASG